MSAFVASHRHRGARWARLALTLLLVALQAVLASAGAQARPASKSAVKTASKPAAKTAKKGADKAKSSAKASAKSAGKSGDKSASKATAKSAGKSAGKAAGKAAKAPDPKLVARCKQKAHKRDKACVALAKAAHGDDDAGKGRSKAGKGDSRVKSKKGGVITTVCGRKYAVAKKKETLAKFARRVHVSADTIRRLNDLGGKGKLRPGRRYLIGKSPHDGVVLRGGVQMLDEPGLWRGRPNRAWGKPLLVDSLSLAIRSVDASYPLGTHVIIGDLSKGGGGCLPPHKSHRGGLDVDIGYWFRGGRQAKWLEGARARTLDADRTWLFLEALLRTGRVQYAFVVHELQAPLYDAALRHGWNEAQLRGIFQFPRPEAQLAGVIRHLKGHGDHAHIRMMCPPEGECDLEEEARAALAAVRDDRLGGPVRDRVGDWRPARRRPQQHGVGPALPAALP